MTNIVATNRYQYMREMKVEHYFMVFIHIYNFSHISYSILFDNNYCIYVTLFSKLTINADYVSY